MQDFTISRFIHHTKEYLKATTRRAIYSGTDAGMKVIGNLLTILLVVSLLPFVTLLLLFAGASGINTWLEIGWGWSFLIVAGALLLLAIIILLLRKVIVRAVSTLIYRKMHSTLVKIDDKLRPDPTTGEEVDKSSSESLNEETATQQTS